MPERVKTLVAPLAAGDLEVWPNWRGSKSLGLFNTEHRNCESLFARDGSMVKTAVILPSGRNKSAKLNRGETRIKDAAHTNMDDCA